MANLSINIINSTTPSARSKLKSANKFDDEDDDVLLLGKKYSPKLNAIKIKFFDLTYYPEPGEALRIRTVVGKKVVNGRTILRIEFECYLLQQVTDVNGLAAAYRKLLVNIKRSFAAIRNLKELQQLKQQLDIQFSSSTFNNDFVTLSPRPIKPVDIQVGTNLLIPPPDTKGYIYFDQDRLPPEIRIFIAQYNDMFVGCSDCGKYFAAKMYLKSHQNTRCSY